MATITMTIPLPVLSSGQHFKTRYRSLPSGSWSSYVNRTNAAFTLTGLTAGDYQMEVILVNADSSECAAVYKDFKVVEDFECIDFSAEIALTGNLYYLNIHYTLPIGFTDPACGWDVSYYNNGTITTHYATLPTGGNIKVLVPNQATTVQVIANLCNGNTKQCFLDDVPPASVPCQELVVTGATIQTYVASGQQVYNIKLDFTNSIPKITNYNIVYVQVSNMQPGQTPDSGIFNSLPAGGIPAGSTSITFPIHPKPWYGNGEFPPYRGTIVDACGKAHCWEIFIDSMGAQHFSTC